MPNHFGLGFWMFHARPDDGEVWKNPTDDGFTLELSRNV